MARRKKDQPTPGTPTPAEQGAAAASQEQGGNVIDTPEKTFQPYQPSDDGKSNKKQRLSFSITEDGLLDTDGTRAETLANVKKFFADPRNAALLGTAKIQDVISEKDVHLMFDMVGKAEAYLFHFAGKIDMDIATKHAAWSDEDKKLVTEPTQRLAAKYAGSLTFYLRWKDEITLGVIMLTISRAKLEQAKMEQAKRVEKAKMDNPALRPAAPVLPNMGLDAVSSEIVKN